MSEQFLHEQLEIAFNFGVPKPETHQYLHHAKSEPAFELRPYQEAAFASFIQIDIAAPPNNSNITITELKESLINVQRKPFPATRAMVPRKYT